TLAAVGVVRGQADVAVLDRASLLELVDDRPAAGREWNREADTFIGGGPRVHRGDDSDNLAVNVEQRSAGVTGVDGGGGLDHVAVEPVVGFAEAGQLAIEVRDYADRDAELAVVAQAIRIDKGERPLAARDAGPVTEFRGWQAVAIDVDDGQVAARVGREDRAHGRFAVVKQN